MKTRVETLSNELEKLCLHVSSQKSELSSLREDNDLKPTNESRDAAADSPLASARLGLNIDESLDPMRLSEQLSHLQSTHQWLLAATRHAEPPGAGSMRHRRRPVHLPSAGGAAAAAHSPVNYVTRTAYEEMSCRLRVKLSQRDVLLRSSLRAQNRLRKLHVRQFCVI